MSRECKVSVICITYNQADYISKAIESMLSQQTEFDYEIIIHDDASTDGTKDILKRYEENYPEKIRVFYEEENQYSKGIDFFAKLVQKKAKGTYIATCEGDDFWIDNHKLQIQYETLEKYIECDMCACWGCTVNERGEKEISQIQPENRDMVLPIESVILGGGQYLVSAGLFFRRRMYDQMLPFEKVIALDYAQQIKGALRGGIYYINRKMAAYRRYAKGSWTNMVLKNNNNLRKQWEKEIQLLRTLDEDTAGKYHVAIERRLKDYVPFEDQLEEHKEEILSALRDKEQECYIWGMGRRGKALEGYLRQNDIGITGVCDVVNENIGEYTTKGNLIFSTTEVIKQAKTIVASNRWAYMDLKESAFKGELLDFHKYMPYG